MKKVITLVVFLVAGLTQAQEIAPKYEKSGALVKVTTYHDNGTVKEQGFYKDKKLQGTWLAFDAQGKKTTIAHYENGKKIGKWFMWGKDGLKEVNYKYNAVASVQHWQEGTSIAVK